MLVVNCTVGRGRVEGVIHYRQEENGQMGDKNVKSFGTKLLLFLRAMTG